MAVHSGAFSEIFRSPLVVAPMSGGPGCPELVAAASEAGAFGFLASGYKSVSEMSAEVRTLRTMTQAPFGVNVFVPRKDPVDEERLDAYLRQIAPEAERLGVALGSAEWDDDNWSAKIAALLNDPVPVVSLTFGCAPVDVVAALQYAGSLVLSTVTTPDEAVLAAATGVDALCVQGSEAGGHQGAFADESGSGGGYGLLALISAVRSAVALPLIAAGGIMSGREIAAVTMAGAVGAQLGTAFLRSTESTASDVHKEALTGDPRARTELTRAFSGRQARGIVNRFMTEHPTAPAAYPHINNATNALRRESVRRGEPGVTNLSAGQGFRGARTGGAADIADRILSEFLRCSDVVR